MIEALIFSLLLWAIGAIAVIFIVASLYVLWTVFIERTDL